MSRLETLAVRVQEFSDQHPDFNRAAAVFMQNLITRVFWADREGAPTLSGAVPNRPNNLQAASDIQLIDALSYGDTKQITDTMTQWLEENAPQEPPPTRLVGPFDDEVMQALVATTTEGPWLFREDHKTGGIYITHPNPDGVGGWLVCMLPQTENLPLDSLDRVNMGFVASARSWVPAALQRIQAAKDLHYPVTTRSNDGEEWEECASGCGEWPCLTAKALRGEPAQ